MKIFIDTSNVAQIQKWINQGVIDGITTNPTILKKDKVDLKDFVSRFSTLPISLEVTTNDLGEMIAQAEELSKLSENIAVKIPVENEFGEPTFGVIKYLEDHNIRVNATCCMSFGQVVMAVKAGAIYVSIFAGRIGDEGGEPIQTIYDSVNFINKWKYKSEIIVGSIRSVKDVLDAIKAGSHIVTVPPEILAKMVDHRYTRETVRQFVADAKGG
jgi:transaldolase